MSEDIVREVLKGIPGETRVEQIDVGCTNASVYALWTSTRMAEYLKIDRVESFNSLRREFDVLTYLRSSTSVPAPEPIALGRVGEWEYLRMSALPGFDASTDLAVTRPQALVVGLARTLRQLHDVPVSDCPFDRRNTELLDEARQRLEAGEVDADDFDEERVEVDPDALLAELERASPEPQDLVVAHGDYCLPNVVFDSQILDMGSIIDVGRLGVADRYLDLALAERSIRHVLGAQWVALFFDAYGVTPDPAKVSFFQALDEFF